MSPEHDSRQTAGPLADRRNRWLWLDLSHGAPRKAVALALVWFGLLVLFAALPGLDRQASTLFFTATACPDGVTRSLCGLFPAAQLPAIRWLRQGLFYLPHVAAIVVMAALVTIWLRRAGPGLAALRGRLEAALAALLIGPVVIVNVWLKEVSGRPRPVQTDLFGGPLGFRPAGDFSGGCDQNCSFISGEAAGAGWLICLVPFLPRPIRRWLGPPVVALAIATPLLRLAFGAHYLSDVLLGFFSSPLVFALLLAVAEIRHAGKKPQTPAS